MYPVQISLCNVHVFTKVCVLMMFVLYISLSSMFAVTSASGFFIFKLFRFESGEWRSCLLDFNGLV